MNDKIIRFLEKAGYQGSAVEPVAMQLLRYFEQEYDVSLLPLLEQEWIDEQLNLEITDEQFQTFRSFIEDRFMDDYDQVFEEIEMI